MLIEFVYLKDDKDGVPLYLPYVNGKRISNQRVTNPKDCTVFSPAYNEFEGYIKGLKDMAKLLGSDYTSRFVEYKFMDKDLITHNYY